MLSIQVDGIEYRFFDHLYAVSRCGKVLRELRPYQPTRHNFGYLCLGRQRLMHRVVATCWIPNPEGAKHVHHINGIKDDNRADNLEWVTPKVHFADRHNGNTGRYIRSPETCAKISAWRTGRKDSEETRALKAAILATNCPKTPCKFKGVIYPSVAAGGRAANLHPTSFRLRCLSKNFPEYELLS
jgi:hypothetical protein